MATLSKHGEQLLVVERLTTKLAYMSNGNILINRGDGWKLWRKVKPGINPVEYANKRKVDYSQFLAERPDYSEYRRLLHQHSFCKRGLIQCALEMLGNDIDGLWSELNDHADVGIDVEECAELARAFESCQRETKERREAQALAVAQGGAA